MQFSWSKRYEKQYRKLPKKIQEKVAARIALFVQDPFDAVLENHALSGERAGQRSISITGDIRIIYELVRPDFALLLLIGTHHELYGK